MMGQRTGCQAWAVAVAPRPAATGPQGPLTPEPPRRLRIVQSRPGDVVSPRSRAATEVPMPALQKKNSSAPVLTVISPPCPHPVEESISIESMGDKIKRLQAEARALAREQVNALAAEIAAGGEAYPVGARELARKLAEDTPRAIQTFEAILHRC